MASAHATKKILVVEDEAIVALDIQEALRELKYDVVGHASSAAEAISLAQKLKPHLILMDIMLKGDRDGIDAARQINELASIPVVFLTAYGDEATLQRTKLANPFGYILKPFDINDLRTAIEIALYRFDLEQHDAQIDETPAESSFSSLGTIVGNADSQTRAAFISHTRLFQGVPSEVISSLAQQATIEEINAGEFIEYLSRSNSHLGIIVTGRVAIVRSTAAGKELIIGLLGAGDCYGLHLLTGIAEDEMMVRTQMDAKVIQIPISVLRSLVPKCNQLSMNISGQLAWRLKCAQDLASSLAHSKVENRIISTLIALIPDFGKTSPQGPAIRIFLTRKELADLTGTTPETAIRVTKNLEREGYLDLTRPGIIKILNPSQFTEALKSC